MEPDRQKFRHEFKYILDPIRLAELKARLGAVLEPDPHGGFSGAYEVRSLYFDDYDNSCYYANEDGQNLREKFRIRIYDGSDATIHLELKQKQNGMTRKLSCPISRADTERLMKNQSLTWQDDWDPLMKRFYIWLNTQLGRPRVIVRYLRIPFIHPDGNVRVTLDLDITASNRIEDFFQKDLPGRPVMPFGHNLLEVKFDQFLPDHIRHTVQTQGLERVTFSKYYLCRKFGGHI